LALGTGVAVTWAGVVFDILETTKAKNRAYAMRRVILLCAFFNRGNLDNGD